jgi:hypothetical protein
MAGRVEQAHADRAERDLVAALVRDEIRGGESRHAPHAFGFARVDVHRHRRQLHQPRQPLDRHAKDGTADVILVIVRGERADHAHTVALCTRV